MDSGDRASAIEGDSTPGGEKPIYALRPGDDPTLSSSGDVGGAIAVLTDRQVLLWVRGRRLAIPVDQVTGVTFGFPPGGLIALLIVGGVLAALIGLGVGLQEPEPGMYWLTPDGRSEVARMVLISFSIMAAGVASLVTGIVLGIVRSVRRDLVVSFVGGRAVISTKSCSVGAAWEFAGRLKAAHRESRSSVGS